MANVSFIIYFCKRNKTLVTSEQVMLFQMNVARTPKKECPHYTVSLKKQLILHIKNLCKHFDHIVHSLTTVIANVKEVFHPIIPENRVKIVLH